MKNKKKIPFCNNQGWLYSNNQSFLDNIYKKFLSDSKKLDISWKNVFDKLSNKKNFKYNDTVCDDLKNKNLEYNFKKSKFKNNSIIVKEKFLNFINAYRNFGHYISQLNPLAVNKIKNNIPELSYSFYKIKKEELNCLINFNFLFFKKNINSFKDIYSFFKKKYCSYIGFEYMHINNAYEKKWLQKYIENNDFTNSISNRNKKNILKDLIQSTTFEKFIHTKFPGSKRFSLEGCDVLIPLLKKVIMFCIKKKTKKIFLGMAHRGRLNVLHNVLKYNVINMFKSNSKLFNNHYRTGDVKYHLGFKKIIKLKEKKIEINLLDNPSHLEIITPVVIGCCKFFIDKTKNKDHSIPIIIHGDAAFIGQGVIQETLNMSQVPAYCVFGSIHIIINNQIAFTTSNQQYLRTSTYCTDVAKMINAPIFHVNADQPELVIFIIKLALKFRYLFKKDVFIELICYRRLGHNEADDPYITQPKMYHLINEHKRICHLYFNKINKIINNENITYEKLYTYYLNKLSNTFKNSDIDVTNKISLCKKNILSKNINLKIINYKKIKKIVKHLFKLPKNFIMHHQIKKIFYNRTQMIKNKIPLDWGMAENLVYSVLMYYGITCRLTGEDVSRGTFCHRHISIVCQKKNIVYTPLKNLNNLTGSFYIWDSVLSEESVLAFEHGYSMVSNKLLNIWEAQFGDFSNGAQIVIDQFIVSSLQKWGYSSPLVILLPHGYEGQGPEHSSGRLERYLQLCAQKNIKIYIPTQASQMYHILLKKGKSLSKKPLIIFTPKSLLRNPLTFISIKKLLLEKFHKILLTKLNNKKNLIYRAIFCSGKIYYELLAFYKKNNIANTIIIRIEQLYPFPFLKINNILHQFINIQNFIWCQEEPRNQGSWSYVYFYFKKHILINYNKTELKYAGRPKLSSTAEGNFINHQTQQIKIIKLAFSI
ncbi:2-oxoglutarate dehydrogenase E1 component [Buchnera aphidicola (Cinara piceae)]|uniref:oxoglutarate dehydrogenase (succinyl-transferring) n=1 Tax=Buchnera aphidicola (Cinara piceae) TaxID=1660043 RepID=A0A803FTU1_9GAMM|nr:2-oxoglutarate dehydrogenase E1 component [Buchnera aphidicola]VFP88307.1 2-oxoglutarate dehydrogenase E1 component [Buchnera aphidicola (Cinara piceae)]